MNAFVWIIIKGLCYLAVGGALTALLSWRRHELFIRRQQFFAPLAYAIALGWPIVLCLIVIHHVAAMPARLLAQKSLPKDQ